jgi:hypothetical protein
MKQQRDSGLNTLISLAVAATFSSSFGACTGAANAASENAATTAGIVAYKSGSYQMAANLLNEAIHPELASNATAMYYRANAFVQIGRPRYALEHYKKAKAITQDPAMIKLCDQAIATLSTGLLQGTIRPRMPKAENKSISASADSAKKEPEHATTSSNQRQSQNGVNVEVTQELKPTPYDLSLVEAISKGPETDTVYKEVSLAVAAIPLRIKRQLDDAGVRWKVVPTLVDYSPEAAGRVSPGWEGKDYSYVGGTVLRKSNEVIIAVRARRSNDGVLDLCKHRRRCTLHETGHAFDHIVLNTFSATPEFLDAYAFDCERLNAAQRQHRAFELQPGGSGPAETFATLFAQAVEQKAHLREDIVNDLAKDFPRSFEVVKRLIS